MPPAFHFLLKSRSGLRPFAKRDFNARLWQGLRDRFEKVLANLFMPDHIHLVLETRHAADARLAIATEARAAVRALWPHQQIWLPAFEPELVPDLLHLKRTIRYVHLNPCRKGLVRDPLAWEWSTHRDAVGATQTSWVDLSRLAEIMRCPRRDLARRFHGYVSGDPDVAIQGTPGLRLPGLDETHASSVERCIRAVAAAARAPLDGVLKKGELRTAAIQLALRSARNPRDEIARVFDLTDRTVRNQLLLPHDQTLLSASLAVLADPRCIQALSPDRPLVAPRAGVGYPGRH